MERAGTGACLLYGISRVVIGENKNFVGGEAYLRSRGVEVLVLDDTECKELMDKFIAEKPGLWYVFAIFRFPTYQPELPRKFRMVAHLGRIGTRTSASRKGSGPRRQTRRRYLERSADLRARQTESKRDARQHTSTSMIAIVIYRYDASQQA